MRDSFLPIVADEYASNECDTLGLHWSDEPRRGGAGVNDMTSVAVSAITASAIQTSSHLPTAAVRPYLGNTASCSMRGSLIPTVADEDASNECDTLGLHWSDEPRRGGAGANDTTSVAVSAITAPAIQTPSQLPNATVQLSSREYTSAVARKSLEKIDEISTGCNEIKFKENTVADEQANNIKGPLTSRMTSSSRKLSHNVDGVAEGTLEFSEDGNEDDVDTQGLRYGDELSRGGIRRDSAYVVSAIRPRSRQTAKIEDIESSGKSPRPPPVVTTSDANMYQSMMPPKRTRQISDTGVINEDDNEDDTDTLGMHYEYVSHLRGSGGGSESVGEPMHPHLVPGAHHVFLSHAAAQDDQQPGNSDQDCMVRITEATLVEEEKQEKEKVIVGTRLEPPEPPLSWWNHKEAKLTLALFCVALIVLSVTLWFALFPEANEITVVQPRSSGTPELSPPSIALSFPPSSSLSPSSSPTMAYMGLFETDCDLCNPLVAIDGDTAVVVRNYSIHFFSIATSSFEIITKIDIDDAAYAATIDSRGVIAHTPTAAIIHNNTAVIGSKNENAVYVYERDQHGTWSEAMLIRPSDVCRGPWYSIGCGRIAWFGHAIAMDDNIIIVGAPYDGEKNQGSVYVYRRNETTWTKEAKLTPPEDSAIGAFGYSVSVKGALIVVGDPGKQEERGKGKQGAVFVYRFDSLASSWNSVGGTQMDYACDQWGYSLRLMDDEDLLVVCKQLYSSFGTVYHYKKPGVGDEYVLKQDLRFDNAAALAVDRNTMVVSEFRIGTSFAIHFFAQNNNVWEEVVTIDESIFGSGFGRAVALSGNITLIASDQNVYQMAAQKVNK